MGSPPLAKSGLAPTYSSPAAIQLNFSPETVKRFVKEKRFNYYQNCKDNGKEGK